MKIKKGITVLFVLKSLFFYSQNCEAFECGDVIHGISTDLYLHDCDQDILVTAKETDTEGTEIGGHLYTTGQIRIVPAHNKRIRIVPQKSCFDINSPKTNFIQAHRGSTEIGGEGEIGRKILLQEQTATLYPNPAETEINIKTDGTILSYTVLNTLGNIVMKGKSMTNNKLLVNSLSKGIYFIKTQTKKEILSIPFIKN